MSATAHRVITPARLMAVASTMALPSGPVRDRYRLEHRAELGALPPTDQIRYAVGALASAWALRTALTQENDMNTALARDRKPLLCRLNIRHKWRVEHAPDGVAYRRCVRCGKDDPGVFVEHTGDFIGGHW